VYWRYSVVYILIDRTSTVFNTAGGLNGNRVLLRVLYPNTQC